MSNIDKITKLRLYTKWLDGDPDQITDDQMREMINFAEHSPIFDGKVSQSVYEKTCNFLDALDAMCTFHKQSRFSVSSSIIIQEESNG